MTTTNHLEGLVLKVGPLGENDRLLTLLSEQEGISRFAVPGARKPKSSLAAASPLMLLRVCVVGRSNLKKIRQLKVIKSFGKIGEQLETLAAAQAIAELIMLLVPGNDPIPGILNTSLIHLQGLEVLGQEEPLDPLKILAKSLQSCFHILALGGYGLPIQECCRSGSQLIPPIGQWEWRCSFLPEEGFAIGAIPTATMQLNPSELALLQRLMQPRLPLKTDDSLIGPKEVWLKLLSLLEHWINNHLSRNVRALTMLRESLMQ